MFTFTLVTHKPSNLASLTSDLSPADVTFAEKILLAVQTWRSPLVTPNHTGQRQAEPWKVLISPGSSQVVHPYMGCPTLERLMCMVAARMRLCFYGTEKSTHWQLITHTIQVVRMHSLMSS